MNFWVWEDLMFAWLISLAVGVLSAVLAVIIAVAGLTGVDGGDDDPNDPGQGQYGDE